jgi:hypothetical protein
MNLDLIANIAEIIGVILVVVTLAFLTLQLRQNTQAIRAEAMKSAMQSEMAFAAILLNEAGVWEKILTGVPTAAGEETRKSILLFNVFMIDTEARFHQLNAGYLDRQGWDGRRGSLPHVIRLPIFKMWRESIGGMSRSLDFLNLLDELAVEENHDSPE